MHAFFHSFGIGIDAILAVVQADPQSRPTVALEWPLIVGAALLGIAVGFFVGVELFRTLRASRRHDKGRYRRLITSLSILLGGAGITGPLLSRVLTSASDVVAAYMAGCGLAAVSGFFYEELRLARIVRRAKDYPDESNEVFRAVDGDNGDPTSDKKTCDAIDKLTPPKD